MYIKPKPKPEDNYDIVSPSYSEQHKGQMQHVVSCDSCNLQDSEGQSHKRHAVNDR